MTELNILCGGKPPLPYEVINLKDVHKIKFYNTSFREYLGVYGDYIIGVYPFAVQVERTYKTDNTPVTYEFYRMKGVRSHHHHNDFLNGEIDTDPCDIYEIVSGVKIHNGELDNHLMNISHKDDIESFEAEIISSKRDSKLNVIGI